MSRVEDIAASARFACRAARGSGRLGLMPPRPPSRQEWSPGKQQQHDGKTRDTVNRQRVPELNPVVPTHYRAGSGIDREEKVEQRHESPSRAACSTSLAGSDERTDLRNRIGHLHVEKQLAELRSGSTRVTGYAVVDAWPVAVRLLSRRQHGITSHQLVLAHVRVPTQVHQYRRVVDAAVRRRRYYC